MSPSFVAALVFAAILGIGALCGLRRSRRREHAQSIAKALEKCDWSNTSIGNKYVIQAAIATLRGEL